MSGMGSTLQLNNPWGHPGRGPGGGSEALSARGSQLSVWAPDFQRFRVEPVAGHQRCHSLRLVRVSWVL